MSELKMEAFRRQLKEGNIQPCYLLYGKEHYLLERYAQDLRKAVLGTEDDPFNLRRLDGKGLDMRELQDALDAYPSFAERVLIEVVDYDLFGAGEADIGKLMDLLKDIPDYCCLFFRFSASEFKLDRRKKKLCEALKNHVQIVECPLQGQNELVRWIQKHFASREKEISVEDASYLIFLCGNMMDNLLNEIGKIAVFAKEKLVTRKDIDAVATPIVEAEIFKLTDALSEKKYDQAAELMYKLFQLNTEPIPINALIGGQLRKLYAAYLVKQNHGNAQQLMEMLGASSEYMPRQLLRICTSFRPEWYLEMIRRSAETDYAMKSTNADPEDLLRTLFAAMAAKA